MDGFSKFLKIADSIDIMIFKENGESMTLSTFIYEIVNDAELIISHPIKEGMLYPMARMDQYYFRFFVENNGMFLFKGALKSKIQFDNLPSLVIVLNSEIKKVQRRKFYRISFLSTGSFIEKTRKTDDELNAERERIFKKYGSIKANDIVIDEIVVNRYPFDSLDLSGGGIRVLTKRPYEMGQTIEGELKIAGDFVFFTGEVTRIEKKDSNQYEVGIKFINLDAVTQSKIVGYVFEVERNLIKKGLI